MGDQAPFITTVDPRLKRHFRADDIGAGLYRPAELRYLSRSLA